MISLGTSFHHRCQVEIIFTIFSAPGLLGRIQNGSQGCQLQVIIRQLSGGKVSFKFYICSVLYILCFNAFIACIKQLKIQSHKLKRIHQ